MRIAIGTSLLCLALILPSIGMAAPDMPADPLDSSQWRYMVRKYFRDATIVFDERVQVIAPDYAEDSLNTPVQVSAPSLEGVEQVLVFADMSPITKVLDYYPVKAAPSIGFSFKVQQATPIRGAMRTADGTWHIGGTWVDAQGGGCTAPSVASADPIWETRLGETEARIWPHEHKSGGERLKFRVVHPMDTGLAAGIPEFFITEITISDDSGQTLGRLKPYEPVSENPVITLDLNTRGALRLAGQDNNGNRFQARVEAPAP